MAGPNLDDTDDGRKDEVGRKPSDKDADKKTPPKQEESERFRDEDDVLPPPKLPDDEMELGDHMDRSEYKADEEEKPDAKKDKEETDDSDKDDDDDDDDELDDNAKRAKYLQKRHDKVMNFLDDTNPLVADAVRADMSGKEPKHDVPGPPDLTKRADSDVTSALPEGTTIADLSVGQFNELMQKNQQVVVDKARAEDRHDKEVERIQTGVVNYSEQLGLTNKEVGKIITKMDVEKIDTKVLGGPTQYGRSICKDMQILALQKQLRRRTTTAEADAEDKGRKASLTRQPKKTDAGAPRKTPEQRHLDDMDRVGPAHSGSGLLDSHRK